jgi:hypothetical protein
MEELITFIKLFSDDSVFSPNVTHIPEKLRFSLQDVVPESQLHGEIEI